MASHQDITKFSSGKSLPLEPVLFTYLETYGACRTTTDDITPKPTSSTTPEPPKIIPTDLLEELRKRTLDLRPTTSGMLLEPATCSYLEWSARGLGALRILEVGTFTGVTSLALSFIVQGQANKQSIPLTQWNVPAGGNNIDIVKALGEQVRNDNNTGKKPIVITLDIDSETVDQVALPIWTKSNVVNTPLVFIPGKGVETLQELATIPSFLNSFDLVFIDADKNNYIPYYKACLPLMRQGGLICVDNVLWKGSVTQYLPKEILGDEQPIPLGPGRTDQSHYLHEFNVYVHNDTSNTESMILPIGDGLTIARKL